MKGTADATADIAAIIRLMGALGRVVNKPFKMKTVESANITVIPIAAYSAITAGEEDIYLLLDSKESENTAAPMTSRAAVTMADAILYIVANCTFSLCGVLFCSIKSSVWVRFTLKYMCRKVVYTYYTMKLLTKNRQSKQICIFLLFSSINLS